MKNKIHLLVSILACGTAAAQTASPTSETHPGVLEPVVVSGTSDPVVAPTTPYIESVIGSDALRNMSPGPAATAQSLLAQEPSMFVYANGPLGVETSIYFRAFNTGQFSETYAGVAVNDVFNGGVTGQAENRNNILITPNNLGAVQIYRGINNPSVNSYNSLGGTVNFNPRDPGDVFHAEVGASDGSFTSYAWHGTVDTGDWNGLKQIVSFEQSGSQGWIQNTADYNNNLYWGATWAATPGIRLANYLLYNNNRGWAPFNMPLPLLDQYGINYQWPKDWTNSYIHDTNWLEILDAKLRISDSVGFENKAFIGRNEYLRTSFSNPAFQQSATQPYVLEDTPTGFAFWLNNPGYPNGPTYDPGAVFGSALNGTDFHFYGYTADLIGDTPSVNISLPGNEIVVGGNLTHGKLHSREYWYGSEPVPQNKGYNDAWDEDDSRTLASVFVQDTVSLAGDSLHLTPGVKYVSARTEDHDSVGFYYPLAGTLSDTTNFLSPTLGVNYQVAPSLNLLAAYGRNVKLPDISAYYGAFQTDVNGNNVVVPEHIKPEHVDDYEIGMRWQAGNLAIEANAYREYFRDTFLTATNPVSLLNTVQNGGNSVYQGFELQLKADLGSRLLPGRLTGYANYAHNQAYFTSSFNSDYAGRVTGGQPLAGVPQNLISAGALWKWSDWRVNLDGQFIGRQYIDQIYAGTPTATTIGGHLIVHLGASKVIPLGTLHGLKYVRLSLNADNLFDRHYLNTAFTDVDVNNNPFVRGVMAAPRTITGSVAVGL